MAKQFEHISIPAGLYLVTQTERCMFPTNLVDDLRRRAVSEWLPSSGYVLRDAPELGLIHWPFEEGNEAVNNSHYCEVWLPIAKTYVLHDYLLCWCGGNRDEATMEKPIGQQKQ